MAASAAKPRAVCPGGDAAQATPGALAADASQAPLTPPGAAARAVASSAGAEEVAVAGSDDVAMGGDARSLRPTGSASPLAVRLAARAAELEQAVSTLAAEAAEVEADHARLAHRLADLRDARATGTVEGLDLALTCPRLRQRMVEPVVAADGYTYELREIEAWMRAKNTSPVTGAPLGHRYLTHNQALRSIIVSRNALLADLVHDNAGDSDR